MYVTRSIAGMKPNISSGLFMFLIHISRGKGIINMAIVSVSITRDRERNLTIPSENGFRSDL